MQISDKGIAFVKRWEGFRPRVYRDLNGVATIGYGHAIDEEEVDKWRYLVLDEPAAEILLHEDLAVAQRVVRKRVQVPLTQGQYDACVAFCFNVGIGAFGKSTLLRKINASEFDAAAAEFPRWCRIKGREVEGLLRRRKAEQILFQS